MMSEMCKCCEHRLATDDGLCADCARDRDVEKLIAEFENHANNPRYGPESVQETEGV